ncbi:MAG: hypothetical protein ABI035_02310 [Gemmatimonadaceae bacterium]
MINIGTELEWLAASQLAASAKARPISPPLREVFGQSDGVKNVGCGSANAHAMDDFGCCHFGLRG